MIVVEVEIPMMGKQYDFQIDENTPLFEVKKEMVEMICRKEQCPLQGELKKLLVLQQGGYELRQENSAQENGLCTGSHLVLV